MKFKDDDIVMVGGLCETMPAPLPGSTRHSCVFCKREVWLSPASVSVVKQLSAYVMCWPCAKENGYADIMMHRDQIAELLLHRERN